jgi:gliding motility-associated-like protein
MLLKNTQLHISKTLMFLLLINFLGWETARAQLILTPGIPTNLVQNVLVGNGVTVSGVTYTGSASAIAEFSNGNTTNLGLTSGIVMCSGNYSDIPQGAINLASTNFGQPGDASLGTLTTNTSYDASVLAFNFSPLGDTIKFRYVFGSEEYPDYVCSDYNDIFGFFVSGPNPLGGNYVQKNIAIIPGTALPVAINTINSGVPGAPGGSSWDPSGCISLAYSSYFIDNSSGATIVYNGFTTILTAWCLVTPCAQYHIKLAVSDAGDYVLDSGVFLEANSFSSSAITVNTFFSSPAAGTDAIEGCNNAFISFNLPSPATTPVTFNYTVGGTATNGTDYPLIPNSVTIPIGQDSAYISINPILDGITEGPESVIIIVQTSVCGGNDTIQFNILDNVAINVQTSNDTTLCGGQATIWASASGGVAPLGYLWDNGLGAVTTAVVTPAVTTTYTVTVTDFCGTTASADVIVYIGSGSAEAGPDDTICPTQQATLTASGGSAYLWSTGGNTATINVSPLTTTTYYVTAFGTCNANDSVTVVVLPGPVVTATSNAPGNTINSGDLVTLSGNGATNYTWTSNPPDPTLAGQQNLQNPIVSPAVTTTYTVSGDDGSGCTGTASITIIVNVVNPQPNFGAYPIEGCEPLIVHFYDSSANVAPGATYYWTFGNGITSTDQDPIVLYETHGTYDVSLTVTNPGGAGGSITYYQYIHVYPHPVALFTTIPNHFTTILEPNYNFFDQSVGPPVKWSWSFGDGDTSNLQNCQHEYTDTGTYAVYLAVANEYNCWDTLFSYIEVRPDYTIFIPNAFTPNNDGKNDYFWIQGVGIEDLVVRIFDRWGKMMFFSVDQNEGWDGKFEDKPAEVGTYVYQVTFRDPLLNYHTLHGQVTIIR